MLAMVIAAIITIEKNQTVGSALRKEEYSARLRNCNTLDGASFWNTSPGREMKGRIEPTVASTTALTLKITPIMRAATNDTGIALGGFPLCGCGEMKIRAAINALTASVQPNTDFASRWSLSRFP